jgi:hypothetical protein
VFAILSQTSTDVSIVSSSTAVYQITFDNKPQNSINFEKKKMVQSLQLVPTGKPRKSTMCCQIIRDRKVCFFRPTVHDNSAKISRTNPLFRINHAYIVFVGSNFGLPVVVIECFGSKRLDQSF